MSKKLYYYVSGNTAAGTKNYLLSNIEHLKQVIILKHESNTVKTAVLWKLIDTYGTENNLEILKSPLGARYLDGIIIRGKSIAFIIEEVATPELENSVTIELHVATPTNTSIDQAKEKFYTLTNAAHNHFKTGLNIHDDLEEIYIKEMNFKRADQLAEELIDTLLQDRPTQNRQANMFHRMFGTNTADGVVNEVPHLTSELKKVYYIKGRAGTGKSTLMKKIAKACQQKGFDVEVYHCSFDPNSLDMVLVRELEFCIFDSTDPHEFFPSREGETILDLYEETVTPGTDEKYAAQIQEVNQLYKSYMKKGIEDLKEAGKYLEEIENQFTFTNTDIIQIMDRIHGEIIK
ncbi:AAA family ATPase [Oceanobacillus chungangensis]|uniref:Nucleotide kinase n=1 Tax=Oceanobacillus chungangensis TaxID=1229152 RepID=A0A3D8PHT3_9BACI|nr:AAA family ATPase [Oceanobacillus chungangensis]RDW15646.1 hypothetical protein CWR45_17895 [Oceanobacillus chungangensis]